MRQRHVANDCQSVGLICMSLLDELYRIIIVLQKKTPKSPGKEPAGNAQKAASPAASQ